VQLPCHHPREPGDFLGVVEDILPVRRPIAHSSDQLDHLGVETVNPGVIRRLLPHFDQLGIQLPLDLGYDLLDPAGMDSAVDDEGFQ
jgi:hypothetical protein